MKDWKTGTKCLHDKSVQCKIAFNGVWILTNSLANNYYKF